MAPRKRQAAQDLPCRSRIALGSKFQAGELGLEFADISQFEKKLKDCPDRLGFSLVDNERAVFSVISNGHPAAHPHSLLLGSGNLVADPLAGHLALELGKGQQNVKGQTPHGGGGVELLGDRDKGHAGCIEDFDDLGEIRQGAGEPGDLIDDDHIDRSGADVAEKFLEGRALHRSAGIPAIIIEGG